MQVLFCEFKNVYVYNNPLSRTLRKEHFQGKHHNNSNKEYK